MNYGTRPTTQHITALGRMTVDEAGNPVWQRPSSKAIKRVAMDHGEPVVTLRLHPHIAQWAPDQIPDTISFSRVREALDAGRPVPLYVGSHEVEDAFGRRRTVNDFVEIEVGGTVQVPWRIACWLCHSVPWAIEVVP